MPPRECPNCGLRECDRVQCFTTEPEHDDEPTISKLTLSDCRILLAEELGCERVGDPLLGKRAA